ncbi:NADH-quinone oxidoreductase subunit NuoE [Aquabacter spiritensis]|uniref:NADH dehydrogenase subunit E n=1 Tax=Aquabacter spiritensis TaxID=933073 RepID=A0A4R3LMI4_9HYPH|nr:NADH dehydrogenase subunit E [Aquabacter spiritensis]
MSVRRLAAVQPESFAFTPENAAWADRQIAKYPEGRQASAVIPLLWKAQEQAGGWLPEPAIRAVAEKLGMAHIRVLEIATFYTMFNLEPVGRHFVQLCGTTPCMLRGAEELKEVCRRKIGPERHVTADGALSWLEVECLGACANAPMVQINYDYFEDLSPEVFGKILDDLAAGRPVTPGSQNGRQMSAPLGGPTTLTDPALYERPAPTKGTSQEVPDLQAAGRPSTAAQSPGDPLGAASAKEEKAINGKDSREKREAVAATAQDNSPDVTGSKRVGPKTGTGVRDPEE